MEPLFGGIYKDYKHRVFFFVKKYIQGKDDIEDVVQDIFVHLWKHQHSLGKNIDAIVFKTAKQEIANFYRKNKLSFSELQDLEQSDVAKDLEDEEEKIQRFQKIENLLSQIPEKSKSYFLKHKLEGLSYSQIAQEHDISKNAVAKHVNKVLSYLKTHIHLFF